MSAPPFARVVDASVAAQLYVPEPLTPVATSLFGLLAADPTVAFSVPDLFYIECANIFWKYLRRGGYPAADAIAAMSNISALRLQRTPTFELTADALPIAHAFDISAYDACYVALSHRLGAPLITADNKLANKLTGSPFVAQWLGAWTPPATTP